ncbi:MAG: cytochrome c oxidase subunit 3 [Geminicoccaceae bacterium]|nr:cytochrome c oxidase subunit 3 [Geminicoccaceae bacterium]
MASPAETADAAHHHDVHHDYHLVDPSPWPAIGSVAAFILVAGGLMYMHEVGGWQLVLLLGFLGVITTMFFWWRDVVQESRHGDHTGVVSYGLRMGMVLFITSEVLFFFAFFWAYFWGAIYHPDPAAVADYTWLPEGAHPVPTWDIPLLNTLILLLSGTTVTWAHHAVREGDNATGAKALALTVTLGVIFTGFQAYEYVHTIYAREGFTISDGIFGSTFYMATGFHGFHVIIGTTFLLVCTMRAWYGHFRADKHIGLEAAAWYWHFVDVVWLFLFVWVYWWGGTIAQAAH